MRLFRYIHPFCRLVGKINCIEDFDLLSIEPCDEFGVFHNDRGKELLQFCIAHPEYHIVSYINPNVMVNRYVQSAFMFFLANGNPDPKIVYDSMADEEILDVLEFGTTQKPT